MPNNFIPPRPGDTISYVCTKCKMVFPHKVPKPIIGLFVKSVKCPACGGIAIKNPAIRY